MLGRPELHIRLIAVGLATREIGLTPPVEKSERGGQLGVATNGMTDRVLPGGQIIEGRGALAARRVPQRAEVCGSVLE